jgi:hypothetical protein
MDKINLEILADGTICVDFDSYSSQNHVNADQFLDELEDLMGSKPIIRKKKRAHQHVHVKNGQKIVHSH